MEQAKRDAILNAATKSFTRHGFKKTSVDDIARGAGVAKGTVYLACESKEELFYQVVHREVRAWVADSARLIDPRVTADDLLARVAIGSVEYLNGHPLVRDLLFRELHRSLPDWAERLDELRVLGRANVIEIVRLGIKQGVFRDDLDVEQVATLLQDIQLATYMFHNQERGRAERHARRLIAGLDLILNGLRARPRAPG